MPRTRYAIAIGSNRPHGRHGAPAEVVRAAVDAMAHEGVDVLAISTVRATPALGPAGRGFANAAVLAQSDREPDALLDLLKDIERGFGRRGGRRWGPRVLDLDIILWSEGSFAGSGIVVPHAGFRTRRFVLDPLAEIVPDWRDPVTGATMRQLRARALKARPASTKG